MNTILRPNVLSSPTSYLFPPSDPHSGKTPQYRPGSSQGPEGCDHGNCYGLGLPQGQVVQDSFFCSPEYIGSNPTFQ